jgi:voltage-gated potassium channel
MCSAAPNKLLHAPLPYSEDATMGFLYPAGAGAVLVTLSLSIQCAGMAALIDWGITHFVREERRIGPVLAAALMVRITSVMIVLHVLQILLWAGFYRWICFPSWESAFYFSTASYSTVGYGDLLLPRMWRSLGPVESVTGVLMCGLSASFLFAIVTRLIARELHSRELAAPAAERLPYSSILHDGP